MLLAEEADYGLYAYSGHPDARWLTDKTHQLFGAIESNQVMNPYLGRTLPDLLGSVGLQLEGGEIDSNFARHGEPGYEFERLTAEAATPVMISTGIFTEDEVQAARAVWSSPNTIIAKASSIAAWARRSK